MKERFRPIDLDRWPRREHYEFFRGYGLPFFSITTAIDVTSLRDTLKERAPSFTIGLVYVLARAANAVPQFRQRIREDNPVEHETVHPGMTILCEGDVFRFSILRYIDDFKRFATEAAQEMENARTSESLVPESLREEPDRDDLLYFSALPWFSFSGMVHPLPLNPLDSVPRFAWGRFEERDNRLVMPLNVQAHHALIDGIHVAKFITCVEELIRIADSIL